MRVPDGLRTESEPESYARAEQWRRQAGPPRLALRWAVVALGVVATVGGILAPTMSGGPEAIYFSPNPWIFVGIAISALGLYWLTRRD